MSSPRQETRSTLSVIVPFFNAPEKLERCLAALARSSATFELILVDDCSSDARTLEIAAAAPARCVRLQHNSGPAAARNAGARVAQGNILAFIDSDVLVEPDTLAELRGAFEAEPSIGACFGSYDDEPDSPGLVTEYRNLLHHYTHQKGPRDATTFWAGCGAIRRDVFEELGGFDEAYGRPSIEDIELGMRIHAAGYTIRLAPEIQCKHLKRWRLVEMIRVDVSCRAIPWTRLLIDRPETGADLNLESSQRWCVVLIGLALAWTAAAALLPVFSSVAPPWWPIPLLLLPLLWINRGLYALFLKHKGALFAAGAIGLHWLYYAYGGCAYAYAHLTHRKAALGAGAAA
jgi:hypothetical protein